MSGVPNVAEGVAMARAAQLSWRRTSVESRLLIINSLRGQIARHCRSLAGAAASGSHPLHEVVLSEVLPLLEACVFLEENALEILEPYLPGNRGRPWWLGGVRSEIHREAFGVVSVISPSNYPLFLGGVQVLQALVAGNAVVWKPAPGGGPVAQRLAELGLNAGLPAGLLIVLEDTVEAGIALLKEPVDKVLFTGGFANGTKVLQALSSRAIPAVLELSGCDAVFVRADADVELVAKALRFGLTFNQSRTCLAPRRVFVERGRAAELESEIKKAFALIACRPSAEHSAGSFESLRAWRVEALNRGARVVYGDAANAAADIPYVFTDVPVDLVAALGDFFAPILCLIVVDSDAAALEAAAQCEYALGASVFSRDLNAAAEMAVEIGAGLVTVNDLIVPSADPRIPFGGSGRSGYGVTRGREGLLELTRIKVIQIRTGGSMAHLEPEEVSSELAIAMIQLTHGGGFWARLGGLLALIRSGLRVWLGTRKNLKNRDV